MATPILQGQFIGVGDNSGVSTGDHIHMQVDALDNEFQGHPLVSVPFSISDHAADANGIAFPDVASCTNLGMGCPTDGPSDNAGVGYLSQSPITADALITNAYMSAGGSSGSWWNVGAPYATGVGPCIFSNNAFVHSCSTQHGTFTVQNDIRFDGRFAGVARNSAGTAAYPIVGANWQLLDTGFRTTVMTDELGPPAGPETTATTTAQFFAGGEVVRSTTRALQDVYLNGVRRAAYYFQTNGPECYDINADNGVDLDDAIAILGEFGTVEGDPPNANDRIYDPREDLDRSGDIDETDTIIDIGDFGATCVP